MSTEKLMACSSVKALLSQYQDNELAPVEREAVEAHLQACESCQKELQQLHQVTSQLKQLGEVETSPYFTARVMGRVMEKDKETSRWWNRLPLPLSPAVSRVIYSLVFIVFLVLGVLVNTNPNVDVNGDTRQTLQQEILMVNLLVESQDLSLLNVQDKTLALLVNGKGGNNE